MMFEKGIVGDEWIYETQVLHGDDLDFVEKGVLQAILSNHTLIPNNPHSNNSLR